MFLQQPTIALNSPARLFSNTAVSGVREVRPVLEKMQDMLGMADIEEPDIGMAELVIELWEERFQH